MVFEITEPEKRLRAQCGCKAGIHRTFCKHVRALLLADESMLSNPEEKKGLSEVNEWMESYGYLEKLSEYDKVKKEVEKAIKKLKEKESSLKEPLSELLRYGITVNVDD